MAETLPEFKNKFSIFDYQDILPHLHGKGGYLEYDEILNDRNKAKGNLDLCVWKRHIPTQAEISSPIWRATESKRILKTGLWLFIKHEPVWLPPPYYTALQYGTAGSNSLEFRLKRLKHVYFKIRARNNPGCKGTLTMKNRGDGETTMAITDAFWECLDGNMEVGQIGIQSKTRSDAINPCWSYVQTLWQTLPKWFKQDFCSDFASGDSIAEKMRWMRESDENSGTKARNILFTYYPSGTPMDGKHDVKKCILDEVCKWEETSTFYPVFTNYSKFIMPGFQRRGMFDMFSSPAQKDIKSNSEVHTLWKDSDTNEINEETGTTKSRVHRYYSNPLEGIHGAYDKWGDADPEKIYDHIMRERKKLPKSEQLEEVRGFPLNDEEMFGTFDGADFWDNTEGIKARKVYLIGTRFKSERTKEPKVLYGNLEWKDGVKDSEPIFRPSDKTEFDVNVGRFCVTEIRHFETPLQRGRVKIKRGQGIEFDYEERAQPLRIVQDCLGLDSVDKRYPGKNPSDVGMVNWRMLEKYPSLIYSNRPIPVEIAYEDAIKAAVWCRAMVQIESLNANAVNWFEDRGYINWMISKIGMPQNSLVKGDAPSGKNSAFLDEIVLLINAATNISNPLIENDPYLLLTNWFYELLDDTSKFNKNDTHRSHLTMAWGQSLMGTAKLLNSRNRSDASGTMAVLEAIFN